MLPLKRINSLKLAVEKSIVIKVIQKNSFMQEAERNYKEKFIFREGNFGKIRKEKGEKRPK